MSLLWFIVIMLGSTSAYRRGLGVSKGYFSGVLYVTLIMVGIFMKEHAYLILLTSSMLPFAYYLGKADSRPPTVKEDDILS